MGDLQCSPCYFSQSILNGVQIEGSRVNLRQLTFQNTTWEYSNLIGFDLTGSKIETTSFQGSNLEKTKFSTAIINNSNFNDCELNGTDFTGSVLSQSSFLNAKDLQKAIGLPL